MFETLDNRTKLLGQDLKQEITKGSKIKIAASCFSMYAFDELKEELSKIKELEFIFTSPTFTKDNYGDNVKKESKEFYIPKLNRESSLFGSEFEIKLRNKLSLKAVARECANWVREKVEFKSNITNSQIPNFINIEKDNGERITYLPTNGFTTTDLGYNQGNNIFSIINKTDNAEQSKYLFDMFGEVWKDKEKVDEVTQTVVDFIGNAYQENSPEFIYFVILYNIFNEFLDDITADDFMPNEATGFKNSLIWNKLYNFQKDGAIGVINKLEKYNGCILADSVGLGKTFTALAVMKYYACRNKNILVLAPKKLANNWNKYRDNVKTNLFYKDRIHYDVLYHTDLGRKKGFSNGHDLTTFNWDNYDLVVIDESHNFRNANAYKEKETRYDFLLNKVMKSGVKTKVLMLSATPVNNRFNDLKNQLALAYCDDYDTFNQRLETNKPVEVVLKNAQRAFNEWTQLPKEERTAQELMSRLDIDFSILLDNVTIARSRKHITKYYDVSEIGQFPNRKKPISYYCDLAKKDDRLEYKDIFQELMSLKMGVYAPMNYILPSRVSKYEELYDTQVVGKHTLKQINREIALQRLMTINMLKRLESCVESFRITLKKIRDVNQNTYNSIIAYEENKYAHKSIEIEQISEDDFEDEDFDLTASGTLGKVKIDFADMDIQSWKKDLIEDINRLTTLKDLMDYITPEKDLKLKKLIDAIEKKINKPINEGNKKVLIFSAFADTTNYLYDNIAKYFKEKYDIETARIQGSQQGNATTIVGDKDTERLLTLFSPISKERDIIYPKDKETNIDILIATDCVSEGQNLQDCDICINYDIHWNPVRIVQRFGRIDRIGSKNDYIQLVNFWPNVSLDEYINLNQRVESRMLLVDATATGDDNIISNEQADLDYRKNQLKKLQDGELQDLEDVDGSISITDLGLNDFRLDAISFIKKYGEPKRAPKGMHAVVKADYEKGISKGVVFVMRNQNNSVNINRQNRLHPYYLVYVNEDGEIEYNHLAVKDILDKVRASCKTQTEPIKDVCKIFNKETDDGLKMDKYNQLLQDAISSIIEVKKESDLKSLFTSGSSVLFDKQIKGLEDFELIAFIVVK